MAKSKVTPIRPAAHHQGKALDDACATFADIRAALVVASEVLHDGAFSRCEITDERDSSAVTVLGKCVEQLYDLQLDLDRIATKLNQPKAIAELKAVGRG